MPVQKNVWILSEEAIGQTTASLLREMLLGNKNASQRDIRKGFWKGEKIQRDKQGNSIYVLSSITLIRIQLVNR